MSCPDESVLLLYTDAELEGAPLRELEAHLVGCRDCRATVVALRDESQLLGDVLQERVRTARTPARPRAPEPGVAIGLPLAVAAVTVALAVLGFLLDSRVPGGLDHLNPLRLKGAYEMAFDLIFFLRDRAPGFVELALSVGAVVGVSAVLSFAVGLLYRRVYGATALVLLGLLVAAGDPARALIIRFDEDTHISAGEVIPESMWVTGEVAYVGGTIQGDLIVAAERVTIAGTVEGSVYTMSRDFELTGTIQGNLHGLVEHARIDGRVEGSSYQVVESMTLAPDGQVARDLNLISEDGIVGGRVGRDLVFAGEKLEVRSEVGRNVQVRWADHVALRDGARIAGDLEAGLEEEEHLEMAPGAEVAGEVTVRPRKDLGDHYWAAYRDPGVWAVHGVLLVAAFLFGLLIYLGVPSVFDASPTTGPEFFRSLGLGFLVIVATPFAILLTALTVVGIPIAVLALFAYVVVFYSAEIVAAAWVGRMVWAPTEEGLFGFGRSFFVGLLLLTLVGHIPFLGPPVMIVATLIGAGLLFEHMRRNAPQLRV